MRTRTDDDRLTPPLGMIEQFYRREERIHIDMEDRLHLISSFTGPSSPEGSLSVGTLYRVGIV